MKVKKTISNTQSRLKAVWIGCFLLTLTTLASAQVLENDEYLKFKTDEPLYSKLTVTFSGDFMQHLPQIEAARTTNSGYDFESATLYMKPFFESADYAVINLETTLSRTPPYRGYPCFIAPAQVGETLKGAGIDVIAMANNHCCDNSYRGIVKTTDILDSLGFKRLGVYKDSCDYSKHNITMLESGSIKLALINYTYGTNGIPVPKNAIVNLIDTTQISRDIELAKQRGATDLALLIHWGYEYHTRENQQQRQLAQWAKDKGVNMVIGGHPHVIQPIEVERDTCGQITHIDVYSMGNFISNQRKDNCDGGLSFRIELTRLYGQQTKYHNPNYLLHWVYIDTKHGRRQYYTLPRSVADTINMDDYSRSRYQRFIRNAADILKRDSTLVEYQLH